MATLSKTSSWQRDRATRLHEAYLMIERSMQLENAALVKSLQSVSAQLDGTSLAGGHILRASWRTLRTL